MELPLRWRVFSIVESRLSFSKAAKELFISQPAVTKHITELEKDLGYSLFERNGNQSIVLTQQGYIFKSFVDKVTDIQQEMEIDLAGSDQTLNGEITIGASSTIGQYIIPVILANFHKRYPTIKVKLLTGNTENIEQAIKSNQVSFGITEGADNDTALHYENFIKDEIVLVCNTKTKRTDIKSMTLAKLKNYPLILREPGSGTLVVIEQYLEAKNESLKNFNIEMRLGNTESIKSYLKNSNTFAFISIHSILEELKNGTFQIIDIKEGEINRTFRFVEKIGTISPLTKILKKFIQKEQQQL